MGTRGRGGSRESRGRRERDKGEGREGSRGGGAVERGDKRMVTEGDEGERWVTGVEEDEREARERDEGERGGSRKSGGRRERGEGEGPGGGAR